MRGKIERNIYVLLLAVISSLNSCSYDFINVVNHSTVKMDDDLAFDLREIDLGTWLSYYTWVLENEGEEKAELLLPDSCHLEPEVWQYISVKTQCYTNAVGSVTALQIGKFSKRCDDFIKYDKWLESIPKGDCPILEFPITGINYEQAIGFCKWRTNIGHLDSITFYEKDGSKYLLPNAAKIPTDYYFTLPTESEWNNFALSSLAEEEKLNRTKDSIPTGENNCRLFNYKFSNSCNTCKDTVAKQNGTGRWQQSKKNKAYEVFGNVSEMTLKKGIAKGGNYKIYARQCHIDSIQTYDEPAVWLGFRCVLKKSK